MSMSEKSKAGEAGTVEIKVKDLPEKLMMDWKAAPEPQGRHLNSDIIPFSEYLAMRRRTGDPQYGFFPRTGFSQAHYDELAKDPIMQAVKDDYTYTAWSMEPDSITFLKQVIEMFKPRVVLELGSGISTPILSAKLKEVWAKDAEKPVYVTIDQSDDYLGQTLKLVEKAGTSEITKSLIFPIVYYKVGAQSPDGQQQVLACYDFNEEKLHEACGGLRPDMIIVDGPTGGGEGGFPFARMLTAPILSYYAKPGALFCLDDAYRDTEIQETMRWIENKTLGVLGVKAVGKGLMMGLVTQNSENVK